MLTEVSGTFVKIAFAEDADVSLMRGDPDRPAARFNRTGQDALYLSPDQTSAAVAIGQYVTPDDPPRVLLSFAVEPCKLLDLRHPDAADLYSRARQPWQSALAAGRDPEPWSAADAVRASGHAGLIDPSRRRAGLWHITLFRWNDIGAPTIRRAGPPTPVSLAPDIR